MGRDMFSVTIMLFYEVDLGSNILIFKTYIIIYKTFINFLHIYSEVFQIYIKYISNIYIQNINQFFEHMFLSFSNIY